MRAPGRTHRLAACITALLLVSGALVGGCAPEADISVAPGPGTGRPRESVRLEVSAAATLKSAFEEMAPAFESGTGISPVFNFGASGQLQKQIEGGVPCDVFASASPREVDALIAGGFVAAEESATCCYNRVVIFVPAGNPLGIAGPEDLSWAERVATGDPVTAPHGASSREWLQAIGVWEALEPRFVFAANAAQTSDFVARGEVDAGVGFASEASARDDIEVVYAAPAEESKPSRYVITSTTGAADAQAARAFVDYVLSDAGQAVLARHGFMVGER